MKRLMVDWAAAVTVELSACSMCRCLLSCDCLFICNGVQLIVITLNFIKHLFVSLPHMHTHRCVPRMRRLHVQTS